MDDDELQRALTLARYPRSAKYPARWMVDNAMGPNPIWLAEALVERMQLRPGMRILDLGCGRALSSVFLAKEFDVQVWATDLWVRPTDNWPRIREARLSDKVFPIYAEARSLPYADDFFDASISIDSYHYFGTDDLYIGYYAKFVKPGGQIGIVVPGIAADPPRDIAEQWPWDWCAFHSPKWWRDHLAKTGQVTVEHADMIPGGREDWLHWSITCNRAGGRPDESGDVPRIRLSDDLGFSRIVARRNSG